MTVPWLDVAFRPPNQPTTYLYYFDPEIIGYLAIVTYPRLPLCFVPFLDDLLHLSCSAPRSFENLLCSSSCLKNCPIVVWVSTFSFILKELLLSLSCSVPLQVWSRLFHSWLGTTHYRHISASYAYYPHQHLFTTIGEPSSLPRPLRYRRRHRC